MPHWRFSRCGSRSGDLLPARRASPKSAVRCDSAIPRQEFAPALAHVVVARKGVQRKRVAIDVILQIKDAGKSRAGKFVFVPGSVFVLIRHQPGNGALDTSVV